MTKMMVGGTSTVCQCVSPNKHLLNKRLTDLAASAWKKILLHIQNIHTDLYEAVKPCSTKPIA